jgi:hypothetical protein
MAGKPGDDGNEARECANVTQAIYQISEIDRILHDAVVLSLGWVDYFDPSNGIR